MPGKLAFRERILLCVAYFVVVFFFFWFLFFCLFIFLLLIGLSLDLWGEIIPKFILLKPHPQNTTY